MRYRAINILLGNACDRHCPYCLQTGTNVPANHPADLHGFVQKLALHLNGDFPRRIIFWGGEPMLYWKNLQTLLISFEKAGINPLEGFFITTHGRRLTDEYVEYANSHKVWTTVSAHDWDFTDEALERIFRLDHFSISVIIEHGNIEFWDLRRRFYALEDRFGFKPRLYLHFLRANDGCAPECYMTKADVDDLCRHLTDDVIPLALQGDDWARWQCAQLLADRQKEVTKGAGGKCVRPDRLSIDLHGNVYECHHNFDAANVVGNLFRRTLPITAVSETTNQRVDPDRFAKTEACRTCGIFSECRGGCYLSNTHDVDCYLARRMHEVYALMRLIPGVQYQQPCFRSLRIRRLS